jgi:precorrin-6B methylase 2
MTDAADCRRAGRKLARNFVAERIESVRQRTPHAYEPWLEPPSAGGPPIGDPLTELLHLGTRIAREPETPTAHAAETPLARAPETPTARETDSCLRSLQRAGLIEGDGDGYRLRNGYLTAFRGMLAIGDHPRRPPLSGVYLGEDGMRIADRLLAERPCERGLDIGSGSGMSTVALASAARRVDAIDLDPACVTATERTSALNGIADRIACHRADATAELPTRPVYDLVAANPPGVPVPRELRYGAAGAGGEDGMQVIGSVLRHAPRLLTENGRLLMRFEAVGDRRGPFVVEELHARMGRGCALVVFVESRIAIAVRSAISARWAAPHNPILSREQLLAGFDRHAAALGATHFYTCSLIAERSAQRRLEVVPLFRRYGRQASLPDGLHELDAARYRDLALDRLDDTLGRLAVTCDLASAVSEVFADVIAEDPIHARVLWELVPMALDSAVLAGAG